ncbi:MAG: SUMF1/EgtB/PvdO family nonheme iron enzyme [Verrucomicrobia bacterium]|nr:SUMF1/EgtB/PvdO family nonheme iron enzyme [Verrucomicrobiota bacterium]
MKPDLCSLSSLFLVVSVACGAATLESHVTSDGVGHIQISWPAIPGAPYTIQTTTNLAQPWQRLEGEQQVWTATTNALSRVADATDYARFFRIVKLDTRAPEVVRLDPIAEAIAVPLQSPLRIWVADETGIDPTSLSFQLGANPPLTLQDPRLGLTNNVLVYTPPAAETLGAYGQKLTATLALSDTLGNRGTNSWTYQMELQTQVSDDVVVVGGMPRPAPQLANAADLTLVTRSGDLFIYRYSGASSGLAAGKHLVDGTPGKSYARTILQLADDPATHTVAVTTEPAPLARLLKEGSLSASSMTLVSSDGQPRPQFDWGVGKNFAFSHRLDLDRVLVDYKGADGQVRVEVLPGSKLDLNAALGFAATFHNSSLTDFQAYVGGSADLRVEVLASADFAKKWEGTKPLIEPLRSFYVAYIGIPVEVETVLEFDLRYVVDLQARGRFQTGITASKDIFVGRRWENGQWLDISRYPSAEFGRLGPEWQLEGQATARVDVVPKLTVYLYSIAGLSGELDPYAEFDGQFKVNPWEYDWTLAGGLNIYVGSDVRVFGDLFPDLNFTKTFPIIPKTTILHDDNKVKPPLIVMSPQSVTRNAGKTAAFGVSATGTEPLSYRWQRNGADLADNARVSGSGSRSLTVRDVQPADAGEYRVRVSSPAGSVVSQAATLTVTGELPPRILLQPQSVTRIAGETAAFGVSATGTEPLSYRWQRNGVDLADNARVSGSGSPSLTVRAVQSADAGEYRVKVSNPAGSVVSQAATLRFSSPPVITEQPQTHDVPAGQTAYFYVQVSGTDPFSFQWQHNGVDLADNARVSGSSRLNLEVSNVQPADAGDYRVRVSNPAGSVVSQAATLTVTIVLPPPAGMALIPDGLFTMGDSVWPPEGSDNEFPTHVVGVGAFYMDKYEVWKARWDEVYQWAVSNGYRFDNAGSGKAANHPVHSINWYDVVKWCNARSEKEGRTPAYYTSTAHTRVYRTGQIDLESGFVKWNAGYRLPTEAEWEKAARGGADGFELRRFPWSDVDTITHNRANYYSSSDYAYDTSTTRGYHRTFNDGTFPYTSPVRSFAPNGYELYDMAGNVWEWCWDWGSRSYYESSPDIDPRGPESGSVRVVRGGGWSSHAFDCRTAQRTGGNPTDKGHNLGFRSVLSPGQ